MGQREERNKQIVIDFYDAVTRCDLEKMNALLADDVKYQLPFDPAYSPSAGTMDKKTFLAVIPSFFRMMKNGLKITFKGMTAEGDRVAAEAESYGETDKGTYQNRYHFLIELRDGKITRCCEYLDSAYANAFFARFSARA